MDQDPPVGRDPILVGRKIVMLIVDKGNVSSLMEKEWHMRGHASTSIPWSTTKGRPRETPANSWEGCSPCPSWQGKSIEPMESKIEPHVHVLTSRRMCLGSYWIPVREMQGITGECKGRQNGLSPMNMELNSPERGLSSTMVKRS